MMPQESAGLPHEVADRFTGPFARFLKIEAAASVPLLVTTLVALVLSNSAWAPPFLAFWNTPVGVHFGGWAYARALQGWINDGAMTLFFFVVALELKRELVLGELRRLRTAALSFATAVRGYNSTDKECQMPRTIDLPWAVLLACLICLLLSVSVSSRALGMDVAVVQKWTVHQGKKSAGSDRTSEEWRNSGGNVHENYYSDLGTINVTNVERLGFAWQYDTVSPEGFEATPVVVAGTMFTSGPRGAVYALDAESGKERWTFTPDIDLGVMSRLCCNPANRGVAVWRDRVYVSSLDGYLYALDATSGRIVWKVDTIADRGRGYSSTGAPRIAGRVVVIGNGGADFDARGYVTAYDLRSGEQRWRVFTVPGDPKRGFETPELAMAAKTWSPESEWEAGLGGTVWDGMAYDPKLNLIYVGTGNGIPEPPALRSPSKGANLFLCSILALKADTGRLVWYYQATPGDGWDYDADAKMILADLRMEGRTRRVLMQANKNGFFYVLDRLTGRLISATPFVRVTWAKGVNPKTGRPIYTAQGDYTESPKLVFPSWWGGHGWQPMAYSPETGLVYIPAMESPVIFVKAKGPFEYQRGGQNDMMTGILPISGPLGLGGSVAAGLGLGKDLLEGQPDAQPHGSLKAWDPIHHHIVWAIDTSGPWFGGPSALWNGGGVMATAGGLLFQGRATGDLIVMDARNGKVLKQIDVGTGMMAAPMTYSINGRQFVAIMAGVGGSLGTLQPPGSAAYRYGNRGRIIAFALDGGAVPHPAELSREVNDFTEPPLARAGTASEVQEGADLFMRNCARCHTNNGEGKVPDLRHMTAATHAEFDDILLHGSRANRGMGDFSGLLTKENVQALHDYLLDLQWQAYENSHADPLKH